MISDKIKILLESAGKTQKQLAQKFNMTPQSFNNKMTQNRFFADDLIKIAQFTNCKILFELPNNEYLYLDENDIR